MQGDQASLNNISEWTAVLDISNIAVGNGATVDPSEIDGKLTTIKKKENARLGMEESAQH